MTDVNNHIDGDLPDEDDNCSFDWLGEECRSCEKYYDCKEMNEEG